MTFYESFLKKKKGIKEIKLLERGDDDNGRGRGRRSEEV
jgi:hypothetical protein